MKLPKWLRAEIADLDIRIARGITNETGGLNALVAHCMTRADQGFVRGLVEAAIRDGLRECRKGQPDAVAADGDGQQVLDLFPGLDLPRYLEVAPGRFVDVAEMTGPDWDAAVVQAETKERNAAGHAAKVRAARAKVRDLLTDDALTTAQVLGRAA